MKEKFGSTVHTAFNRRLTIADGAKPIPASVAWLVIGGLFCVYFLASGWDNLLNLLNGVDKTVTLEQLPGRLTRDIGFAMLAIVAYRLVRPSVSSTADLDAQPAKIRRRTVLIVAFAYLTIMLVGNTLGTQVSALPIWDWAGILANDTGVAMKTAGAGSPLLTIGYAAMSLLAGINEEIALVALPLILFRRAGVSLNLAVPVLIFMRMSFHIYHGLPIFLTMALWAGLALWLYLRTSTVLPLIIGHAFMDIGALVFPVFGPAGPGLFSFILFGIAIATVVFLILGGLAHRRARSDSGDGDRTVGSNAALQPPAV